MTSDDKNKVHEYIEGYMLDLTYNIVTKKIVLSELVNSSEEVILSYDPFAIGDIDQSWLLQDLIDHYIETEEYEKCAKLLQMKHKVESGALDLSDRIYLKDEDFKEYDSNISDLIEEYKNKYNQN